MKLQNQFQVDAPLERTWSTLLDIQRVAQCLPGAEIESDGADGVYRGSMQVKLGPMSLRYAGTARMAEVEEDHHVATIEVQAKELRGQGTASARIRNQLQPGPEGATQVTVQTDLSITGRPAQFGRGIMEDVAGKMLDDFASRLENEVLSGNGAAPDAAPAREADGPSEARAARPASQSSAAADESSGDSSKSALDLGPVLLGPVGKRAGIAAAVLLLALLLGRALTGTRRSGLSVTINWR